VAQLALTPIVLTGAGLMMRSIVAQHHIDPGVDTAGLIRVRLDLTGIAYSSAPARARFYRQLDDRLESDSSLRATLVSHAPFEGSDNRWLSLSARPATRGEQSPGVRVVTIGRRYFETLGSTPVRGSTFTALDDDQELIPAIVNERFVEVHTAGRDPHGQIVTLGMAGTADAPDHLRIIGVAPNIRQGSTENADGFEPIVYVPYAATPRPRASIIVRSDAAPAAVASSLRAHVRAVDPNLPLFDVMRLDDSYAMSDERVGLAVFGTMFATFAVIALLLAAVGLYSVTAYATEQRTREIGLRIALGAQARQIWWLVTRSATRQVAVGLSVGIAGAIGLGQLLRGLLIGTSATDPVTLAAVTALLALVTFLASVIPARRAIRIDPIATLRSE
jgi:predicted permease